jgi:hypothetical protein
MEIGLKVGDLVLHIIDLILVTLKFKLVEDGF